MSRLHNIKNLFEKFSDFFGKIFHGFFDILIESYGWRGFLFRIIIIVISFGLISLDDAVHGGPAGLKLWLVTCALVVYCFGKLIYDYTKAGKESEAKKHNKPA